MFAGYCRRLLKAWLQVTPCTSSEAPPTLKDSLLSQVGELQLISKTGDNILICNNWYVIICMYMYVYTLYAVYIYLIGVPVSNSEVASNPKISTDERTQNKQISLKMYIFTVREALECAFFLELTPKSPFLPLYPSIFPGPTQQKSKIGSRTTPNSWGQRGFEAMISIWNSIRNASCSV